MMETYHGYVRTPADAIKLFEACRLGLLPRVQRRLSEKERQSIQSGSVFVWDEREAGMRRWTDGKSWSASRVSGSFLTYREMEGKRGGGFGNARRGAGKTPDSSGRGSDEDQDDGEPDGYRYKADGLMKQSFSITTSTGQHLHLISYYSRPLPGQQELQQPSSDSALRGIVPVKGMYPESSMNEAPLPAMTRAPMQQPPYPSPHQQPPPPAVQQYPQYAQQPGYSWPPSPIATPPYSHYTHTPGYPQQNHQNHLPPPPAGHYAPQPNYSPAPHYERVTLPPPIASTQARASPPHLAPYNGPGQITTSPHMSQPQLSRSPRLQHLQTHSPQGSAIDPKLTGMSARNPQGLLPALSAAAGPTSTPPQRALSASPPRSSHSDLAPTGNNKASLSALLHPTPASSEPNSANPGTNSAGSSPRQMMANGGALSHHPPPRGEDARALSVLDRKFRI